MFKQTLIFARSIQSARVWIAPILLMSLVGCSAGKPGLSTSVDRSQVWPQPPEQPRIAYVGQLSGADDLRGEASFMGKVLNTVAGSNQDIDLELGRPTDVYSPDGNLLFVTDANRNELVRFDLSTGGVLVIGNKGPGTLGKPFGLGGDPAGRVLVTDPVQGRVSAFDLEGQYLSSYGGKDVLLNPVDVAMDTTTGNLWVVDSYLHQVVVFRPDGSVLGRIGKQLGDLAEKRRQILNAPAPTHGGGADSGDQSAEAAGNPHGGTSRDMLENRGAGKGEFLYPVSISAGTDGRFYVSDGLNCRIQVFDQDLAYITEFGRMGDTPGSFARPKGVAVDSENHIYVLDAAFNNVQVFDTEGRLLLPFSSVGTGPGQLWIPFGVHIDSQDRIYITDRYNGRVQIFDYLGEPQASANDLGTEDNLVPPTVEKGENQP